jgi:hypothetical protein
MKSKKEILIELYNLNIPFFIIVETNNENILIPDKYYDQETLTLKLSSYFKNSVVFDNAEIKTTLSFEKKEQKVILPYESIKVAFNDAHYYIF